MHFRTELHPAPAAFKLNLTSKVVTVGSCFSDVIGLQLEKYKVETLTNPFGTIFNPLSACKLLQICAGADVELADSFVQNNGRWYSYDFHSSFSAETEEELYEMLDEVVVKTRRFLKKADLLLLTLGTANIFRLNITGETVANCHKLPAANFTRETLLPEEIITCIAETQSLLRELNPNLKLGLTVSPVRHLKDTLELNSVSKAVLRLATHYLSQNLPEITYFPAYELLIDDLRDYRFYKEDMLHPTALAETYIWEKFTGAYFEISFREFTQEWDKILRAMEHKPFHPASEQHQNFVQQTLEKLRGLAEKVDITQELAYFESQVMALPEPVEENDEEDEDETAEEEVIPGYFSEEMDIPAAAALEETVEVAQVSEDGAVRKKKKKKPRKKKKKPAVDGEVSLSEVGTTVILDPQNPESLETVAPILTEAEAVLTEILAEPEHPVGHYGETINETPLIKPKSRSAKRRESRRKKKALATSENYAAPEISEEVAGLLQTTESALAVPEPTFEAPNPSVLEEKREESPVITVEKAPEAKPKPSRIKPAKKGGKKNAFTPLFTTEVPENTDVVLNIPEPVNENMDLKAPEPVAPVTKSKGRGRKPKTAELFAAEPTPVTEKIAVPFVPAKEIEEPLPEPDSPVEVAKPVKLSRPTKTTKGATKEKTVAETAVPAKTSGEKLKATTRKRKPAEETVPAEIPTEKAPVKRGRKKKTEV